MTAATFAKGLEELPRFEWRGVPYSSWLYRVASNLVARQRRRPAWIELAPGLASDEPSPLDEVEKEYILAALELNGGNQTRSAAQLKIGTTTLHRKLKSYGMIGAERGQKGDAIKMLGSGPR